MGSVRKKFPVFQAYFMSEQDPVRGQRRSAKLTAKFHEFLEQHSPSQVSRHLRCIVLDYISNQLRTGLPPDFHIYIWELFDLFDLLDCAIDETEHKKKPKKARPKNESE